MVAAAPFAAGPTPRGAQIDHPAHAAQRARISPERLRDEDAAPREAKNPTALSKDEMLLVDQLSARDREVRAHEQAHVRVGGPYAGRPSYQFQLGPDGKRYAVGGEVPIDIARVPNDPAATIAKMETVRAAALAPAEPSDADRRVAAIAEQRKMDARLELSERKRAEREAATPEEGARARDASRAAESAYRALSIDAAEAENSARA